MGVNEKMTAIADAIRLCTETTEPMGLEEMAHQVGNVYLAGAYDAGYQNGKSDGHLEGQQARESAFWDMFQENGNRTDYRYAFAYTPWDDANFNPKYPLVLVGDASYCFVACQFVWPDKVLQVDTSRATNMAWFFRNCNLKKLGKLDLSSATNIHQAVSMMHNLVQIQEIVSRANLPWSNTFQACPMLESVRFSGVIGSNGLSFADSKKLDRESILSIINALSDTAEGLSITLSAVAVNAAFPDEEEWEAVAATKHKWTINLV